MKLHNETFYITRGPIKLLTQFQYIKKHAWRDITVIELTSTNSIRMEGYPFLRPIPNVTTIDSNCLLSDKFLAKRTLNRWRLYFASCIALRPPFRIGRKCAEAEAPVKKGQEVERVILRMTWNTSLYKRSEVEGTALPRSSGRWLMAIIWAGWWLSWPRGGLGLTYNNRSCSRVQWLDSA